MAGILNWEVVEHKLEQIGKNQTWLADELGVSNNTVSNWAYGYRQIASKYLYAMADLLKLDVRQLLIPNKKSPYKDIDFPPKNKA
jgi:putative transcriptional regulator